VDDLLEGLIAFMDQNQTIGPLNLGNPAEATMLELAETVIRLSGSSSRLVFRPLPPDDPKQRCPDVAKARALLGWDPKVTLEDGLKETIAYFRDRLA
jgi:UDP-glucuronate decarboxylase